MPKGRIVGYRKYWYDEVALISKTPQSYYWLGFIAADGNISSTGRLIVGLAEKDLIHLQKLCGFLSLSKPPSYKLSTKSYEISVMLSKKVLTYIKENLNITTKKSLTYEFPKIEQENLLDCFIIGYIDGDGSWNWNKKNQALRLGIRGTFSTLESIRNRIYYLLSSNKINKISTSDGYPHFQISGKKAVKLYNYYRSIDIYKLSRKWDWYEL